jgi:hypothetical protein
MECKSCGIQIGVSCFGLCGPCAQRACQSYITNIPHPAPAEGMDMDIIIAAKGVVDVWQTNCMVNSMGDNALSHWIKKLEKAVKALAKEMK